MQAVGRLGSYISRSVDTVSAPFHPFGGAVDIIVVEQPDGTYKSSPWYVRFGKFQGVLKSKEKVVGISVNDVEADFHMYLDHKGEAYFVKEVDVDEGESAFSPLYSSGEDSDRQPGNRWALKSKSCNYDGNWSDADVNARTGNSASVTRTNSQRPPIFGLVFGRRSMEENGTKEEENESGVVRADSLERAEIAADLLDLKWSTNLDSPRHRTENESQVSLEDRSKDEVSANCETGRVSHSSCQELEDAVEGTGVEMKCLTSEYVVETATSVESVREDTISLQSRNLTTDTLSKAKSNFDVNSVNLISEIPKPDSLNHDSVGKLNGLSNTKEGNATDNIQSVYYSEQKSCTVVCHHTETVQNMTQSISVIKLEPERDLINVKEQSFIQKDLGKQDQFSSTHEEKMSLTGGTIRHASESIVTESCSQQICLHLSNGSQTDGDSQSVVTICSLSNSTCPEEPNFLVEDEMNKRGSSLRPLCDPQLSNYNSFPPFSPASGISEDENLLFGNLDDFVTSYAKNSEFTPADHEGKETDFSFSSRVADGVDESSPEKCCTTSRLDQPVTNGCISGNNLEGRRLRTISSDICINRAVDVQSEETSRIVRSLPSMSPLSDNLEASDLSHSSNTSLYAGVKSGANHNQQSPVSQAMVTCLEILPERKEPANSAIGTPPRPISSFGGSPGSPRRWSFSFKKSKSMKVSHLDINGCENPNGIKVLENAGNSEEGKDVVEVKINKKKVRTLAPTSEQLASLNLQEGRNTVVFTFSTAMLGKQQVDARIFRWRWDTRIVISDVDGTITRSDLLGQVMPLVGMDWSQTGVAHLFSAIKENGYELLFLSARSIAQSFITRQFLFNIKQDGKALPDGPVVISPDGLFPSLFREVVRRAPHEFKISCLEDIKALFPADSNPFYAGFGNRDTDEFSYLKVGIPRGKIFIINPKGEIAVNRRVDTKSYQALHALVHGMFPTMSSEQEDYNSWNYWKIPPPTID